MKTGRSDMEAWWEEMFALCVARGAGRINCRQQHRDHTGRGRKAHSSASRDEPEAEK